MGRVPGTNGWQLFSAETGVGPTPGFSNDAEGRSAFEQSRVAADTELELLITEVMSSNKMTLADNTGTYSDYVEIYNEGGEAVNLAGCGLSDDPDKTLKWKFPDVTLEPGKYLVVYASGRGEVATDLAAGRSTRTFGYPPIRRTSCCPTRRG